MSEQSVASSTPLGVAHGAGGVDGARTAGRKLDIDSVLQAVSDWYGITTRQLVDTSETTFTPARRVAALILRYQCQLSWGTIARVLGYARRRSAFHLTERATHSEWNIAAVVTGMVP